MDVRLVGTKFVQPYMHGFFMDGGHSQWKGCKVQDYRLHAKLKAALEPFAFEEYRKQKANRVRQRLTAALMLCTAVRQVKERLEAKRTMRTRIKKDKAFGPLPSEA